MPRFGILSVKNSMTDELNKFAPTDHEPAREPEASVEKSDEKGNWFHRNRWFTKEPITYTGYQFFRSAMATIPYGFGMAGMHRLMGWGRVAGERAGLTPKYHAGGVAGFDAMVEQHATLGAQKTAALLAKDTSLVQKLETDIAALSHKIGEAKVAGRGAELARGAARVAGSPLNQALQIGLGFTMFRFVGGLVKGQRDKVMNEKNTAEDTNRETKNWAHNIKEMAKTNWTAESTGTPVAALTLGFASANFKPVGAAIAQKQKLANGAVETFGQAYKRAVFSPHAKIAQNAAIWTIAYSIFFEASERIFKDMQLKRGKWLGNANSLKNVPDDPNVGGYAADGHTHEFHQNEPPPKPKLDILTGDPSICRFVFRRVLPVAVGITGYAFMKRGGYILGGGPMQAVTHEAIKEGFAANVKHFGKDAYREGLATSTFGVLWMATDAWGSWYDKFFSNLQDKAGEKHAHAHPPQKQLNEHQSKNMSALQEKLNAQELGQGRVA